MLPGLPLWALTSMLQAVSEPPRARRPALLSNGAFLLATVAVLVAVF